MRKVLFLTRVIFFVIFFSACGGNDDGKDSYEYIASEAELLSITFVYNNSVFNGSINGENVRLDRRIPYGVNELTIKSLVVSENGSSNVKIGEKVKFDQNSATIALTSEDGKTSKSYSVYSQNIDYNSIVEKHGNLHVLGNKIVGKNNEPVSLAGNSFFWSNNGWGGERFYKTSVVSWLKLDWETTIVRAAMGVDESGGYLEDKLANKNKVKRIVDAAIDEGIYVIIDWHSHHAEDYREEAIAFFKEMAQLYGGYENVIYEIYNEPLDVSWSNTLKPYSEAVIAGIREFDADNLILVGTPNWSQKVDEAAADPITGFSNIAYVLHFYSIHHQQWLRDLANKALDSGIALFVSEWGPLGYTQDDPETEKWMKWCKDNQISHCSWAVNDKEEEWSIVKNGSNTSGGWSDKDLTESGKLERNITRNWGIE